MRRWALEETGRNSVSPCTRPRTTASNQPMLGSPLRVGGGGRGRDRERHGRPGEGAGGGGPARRSGVGTVSGCCRRAPVGWPLVEQRALGRSGLVVSRLALGTMTWGRDTDED